VLGAVACVLLACSGGAPRNASSPDDATTRMGAGAGTSAAQETARTGGWAIVVESFGGATATQRARQAQARIGDLLGRSDMRIRSSDSGAALLVGSYSGPDDPRVGPDLRAIRATRAGGSLPFIGAFLAPPPSVTDPGAVSELSLLSAKNMFGERAAYTLQIGVYESPDREVAKRAAEEAAVRLRTEGVQAFYHHGPRRSMVPVGVFAESDLDSNLQPASPALIALQQRYPLNLLNGQFPIVERHITGGTRKQPSTLVRIPGR